MTKRKDNMTISVIIGSTRQGRFSESRLNGFFSSCISEKVLKLGSSTSESSRCLSSISPCPQLCLDDRLTSTRW